MVPPAKIRRITAGNSAMTLTPTARITTLRHSTRPRCRPLVHAQNTSMGTIINNCIMPILLARSTRCCIDPLPWPQRQRQLQHLPLGTLSHTSRTRMSIHSTRMHRHILRNRIRSPHHRRYHLSNPHLRLRRRLCIPSLYLDPCLSHHLGVRPWRASMTRMKAPVRWDRQEEEVGP